MKTNLFSKVAVTMMTVALGAGVVGSISGTVAWFQYSTRSTVAFTGTSAHCTENLQIRLVKDGQGADEGWKSDLSTEDVVKVLKKVTGNYYASSSAAASPFTLDAINTGKFYEVYKHGGEFKFTYNSTDAKWYLGDAEVDLAACGLTASEPAAGAYIEVVADAIDTVRPVTSGALAEGKVAATLYRNPLYQYPNKTAWKEAKTSDFVTIPLELRVKDVDGDTDTATLAKNIYVSKMDMAVKENGTKGDITPALRVAISTSTNGTNWSNYGTFSKDGQDVDTYGKLDLNGEAGDDTYGDFEWDKGPEILYGYEYTPANINVAVTGASGNVESATINDDWFLGAHGPEAGNFVFAYDGAKWKLGENEVDIAKYGIELTFKDGENAPNSNDKLTVTVVAEAAGANVAKSYGLTAAARGIADDSDPYNISGTPIGSTGENGGTLRVNVKVYLEGWKKLGTSALWDAATYIESQFNLGIRFSADAHTDH